MSTLRSKDRASLCSFIFADGRRCRTCSSPATREYINAFSTDAWRKTIHSFFVSDSEEE